MEGKNKKTKVFKWAAVLMLAAMMIVGCKQAQGSSSSGEENKKTETPVTPNTPAAAEKYAVTFGAGEHGTLKAKADGVTETDKSPISVEKDKTVTFTATANTGYVVEKWTVTPAAALQTGGANGSDTATAKVKVTANTTVNVTFKQQAVTPPPPSAPADKTYTVGGISFTMKGIAAVTNGSVGDNSQSDNNVHKVSLTAYRIGETEVTQELWQAVMGNNPSNFKGAKNPVEQVNWYHAIAFCNKLSIACHLDPCYTVKDVDFNSLTFDDIPTKDNGKDTTEWKKVKVEMSKKGFRLPTEAEWEWAAKGGTEDKWAGVNKESKLGEYAWYSANSGWKTHEVKKKTANGYGLYDMSGNVWEWCWDRYGALPNPLPEDYSGADSDSRRVRRGGSFENDADYAARAYRGNSDPDNSISIRGLRVVSRP